MFMYQSVCNILILIIVFNHVHSTLIMIQYLFWIIASNIDNDRFNTVGSVNAVVLTKLHNYKAEM